MLLKNALASTGFQWFIWLAYGQLWAIFDGTVSTGITGSLVMNLTPKPQPVAQWGLNQETSDSERDALTHWRTFQQIYGILFNEKFAFIAKVLFRNNWPIVLKTFSEAIFPAPLYGTS